MIPKIGAFGFKEETEQGVAETIAAANLLRASTESKVEFDLGLEEQNILRDDPAKLAPRVTNKTAKVSIPDLEIKGSGAVGTAPACGDLLECAGFLETVLAGFGVKYVPVASLINANIKTGTTKEFRDGKYRTARGVRGNLPIKAEAGKVITGSFDGQGVFVARGDLTTPAAPANSPIAPIFHSATMAVTEHHPTEFDTLDGLAEKLRDGAASNLKFAIKSIQGAVSQKVLGIALNLQKVGTPATETNGVWLTIEGDDLNLPDGEAISKGTSEAIATRAIDDSARWVIFWFKDANGHFDPPTLANGVTNWIVLQGDYAPNAANCIQLDTDACVEEGDMISLFYDTTWTMLASKNVSVMIFCAVDPVEKFAGFELNPNNAVELEDDPNYDQGFCYAKITGQDPEISVEPLEKTDALRDWIDTLEDGTDMFFHAQTGVTAGNIIEFTCLHCKIAKAGEGGDRKGNITHPITLQVEDRSSLEILFR